MRVPENCFGVSVARLVTLKAVILSEAKDLCGYA